jgi:salicylate hydroxylase
MGQNQDRQIAIIGAGIGGLTAALALQQYGCKPTVYEQAPVLGEIGAGLTVSPNSARVFDFLGLTDELRPISFTPPIQMVRHYRTGEVLLEIPRGDRPRERYGAGYYFVHRADLHALLVRRILANDAAAIRLGARLHSVEARDDGATGFLADGSSIHCDVLIGADGVRSAVRDSVFAHAHARFTGHVAWRGLVPRDALPADVRDAPAGIHIGPAQLFMRYPLRQGSLINYVAFSRDTDWTNESWSARSTVEDVVSAFDGWDRLALDVIKATPKNGCFKWALFTRDPLPTWRSGRVSLLGDAAHAMLPFMGQGAAMSIEDAMVLARALSTFADPSEALIRYETVRRDHASFVQAKSRALADHLQAADPERFGEQRFENEEALGLFAYDATTVPL